jgi:inhibitor of cysteine peptidase
MKVKVLIAVAMLVSSAVLGCSSSKQPSTRTIQVSMDDVLTHSAVDQNVTLAVGDTLKVMLGSNQTTPFRWTADAKIGDATIVKQDGHEFVRPDSDLMGAPGNEVWTFTALKAGKTTIVTDYAGIVGSDAKPVCTFTAKVTVQ